MQLKKGNKRQCKGKFNLRFIILTQYFAPEIGATQIRLGAITKALMHLGHGVEVVTALPNYPAGKIFPEYRGRFSCHEEIGGAQVHRVWVYPASGAGGKRILNYLSFMFTSLVALWRIQRPDFLLVDSPPLFLSLPGFVASRWWKTGMIFNVADLWPDEVREMRIIRKGVVLRLAEYLETWTYLQAEKVNAVTEGIRSRLIQKGVPEHKLLFLPNGANLDLFQPRPVDAALAQELGLGGKKVFLYAGGMGFVHGLGSIIEAAKNLSSHEEICFVFIGGGPEKSKLQKRAKESSLHNVVFMDPAPPEYIARLYSLATAGLVSVRALPSFNGFRSAKMFPAMASGVPLIYCGIGEGPQLVREAEAGLVIEPENAEALMAAVLTLAEDTRLSNRLGRNGRKYMEKNLDWNKLVEHWLGQLLNETRYKPAGP
jgi:colanic acid biosynthesis glycosyl transferase WcaI